MSDKERARSANELAFIEMITSMTARLPHVEVGVDGFGHTTFRIAKKPFVIVGAGYDGDGSLSIKADPVTQEALVKRGPYVRTPYLAQHGWISLLGEQPFDRAEIEELVVDAFYRVAPKRIRSGDRSPR